MVRFLIGLVCGNAMGLILTSFLVAAHNADIHCDEIKVEGEKIGESEPKEEQ